MEKYEAIRVEIAKLELKPGDTLVLNIDQRLSREELYCLQAALLSFTEGLSVRSLILEDGMKFTVIREAKDANPS